MCLDPVSSTHTKEFFVASRNGFAISDISTANRGKSRPQIIPRTHANENRVARGEIESLRGNGRSHVREDGRNAYLSEVGGFTAHIRTGEKEEVFVCGKVTIVRNELFI